MNEFYSNVYKLVAEIPEGKIATYGQIAALLGSPLSARMVGRAMYNAPDDPDLPCHRVVYKTGALLTGCTFGSEGFQRAVLEKEGVVFKDNGCIDMEKCLWNKL